MKGGHERGASLRAAGETLMRWIHAPLNRTASWRERSHRLILPVLGGLVGLKLVKDCAPPFPVTHAKH